MNILEKIMKLGFPSLKLRRASRILGLRFNLLSFSEGWSEGAFYLRKQRKNPTSHLVQ
jgi:hypothetical protein